MVVATVVEIVLLVAVLALYVIALTRRLHAIADILAQVSSAVGVIAGHVSLVGAGAATLNRKLDTIGNALPVLAKTAESLAPH